MSRRPVPKFKVSRLDRAINAVSPKWGAGRLASKAKFSTLSQLASGVQRTSGGTKGTLSSFRPSQQTAYQQYLEREETQERTQWMVANDPHAASAAGTKAYNEVGTGLRPQSEPVADILKINETQTREFAKSAEWAFSLFNRTADYGGRMTFYDQQFLACMSYSIYGEHIFLPLTKNESPRRRISLCLQNVNPLRLKTPSDMLNDDSIMDGVQMADGEPDRYWFADPKGKFRILTGISSGDFKVFPAWLGHRPGVIHAFQARDCEQVRGYSDMAPAIKSLRDLYDYLDAEVVAAWLGANFTGHFNTSAAAAGTDPFADLQQAATQPSDSSYERLDFQVEPGTFISGPGKFTQIKPERPAGTFPEFIKSVARVICAVTGQSYEQVIKDFSDTNYSSARAALNESWKVYLTHRAWLVNHFCQVVWEMVLEEAYLRGMLKIPKGAARFYDEREAWCAASWTGPARGYVDPVKEIQGYILALASNLGTLRKFTAEQGDDWESNVAQRGRENRAVQAEGLPTDLTARTQDIGKTTSQAQDSQEEQANV